MQMLTVAVQVWKIFMFSILNNRVQCSPYRPRHRAASLAGAFSCDGWGTRDVRATACSMTARANVGCCPLQTGHLETSLLRIVHMR
jgi:hypothetical protein